MPTEEQWKAMSTAEKQELLETAIPEASKDEMRVVIEGRRPKVAKITIQRYNRRRRRPDGGSA